jgi:hypothetical protein
MGTGVLSREQSDRVVELTTKIHLAPSLKKTIVIPLPFLPVVKEGYGNTTTVLISDEKVH